MNWFRIKNKEIIDTYIETKCSKLPANVSKFREALAKYEDVLLEWLKINVPGRDIVDLKEINDNSIILEMMWHNPPIWEALIEDVISPVNQYLKEKRKR